MENTESQIIFSMIFFLECVQFIKWAFYVRISLEFSLNMKQVEQIYPLTEEETEAYHICVNSGLPVPYIQFKSVWPFCIALGILCPKREGSSSTFQYLINNMYYDTCIKAFAKTFVSLFPNYLHFQGEESLMDCITKISRSA